MKFSPSSLSLRTKLLLSFIVVIIIGGLLSLSFGYKLVKNTLISQAQVKVQHDLASAWMVFNEKLNDIKDIVCLNAAREGVIVDIKNNRRDVLLKKLSRVRKEYGLDVLTLTDDKGIVIVRTRNPDIADDDQSQDAIMQFALKNQAIAIPQIIPRKELLKEGLDLAEQAYMEFIQTPKATFRPKGIETSGMMLKSASPVVDENNTLLGILYGGILLNRNYEIVDRIKEIVYKGVRYEGWEIGTATIFQQDLRISTNVMTEKNERAIGTRVSKEVNDAVLKEGSPWIDRAFVVNDWYITAYEPIRNIDDKIIGMLYVGMLEKPYIDTTRRVMFVFILMAFVSVIFLFMILYFSTTKIIKPLQKMVVATQKIAKGDLSHEIKVNTRDEIGVLAHSFNSMSANLKSANEKLIEWGKTLKKKVDERTRELQDMQACLIQSEKLASIGKLSASIAHEINNPLGAILVYGHLMLEDTDKESPYYENLKKMIKETTRCKDIVKGLLEFARPKEPDKHPVHINKIVEKSLSLVDHQVLFQNVKLIKHYASSLPLIVADSTQLQQVFTNIILNASEAMNGNGVLTLTTSLSKDEKSMEITFSDTGTGIKEKDKGRLFEPFFSTKEVGKGTGLGLSISYGIVQKHQGTIEVKSEAGKGATFIVKLPVIKASDHERKSEHLNHR